MVKVLELTCDIKNPNADRRSKNWNKLPILKAGQRFTLHKGPDFDYLYSCDSRYHMEAAHQTLGKLIIANAIESEPKTLTEMKRFYDCDYDSIEDILFELGRIDAADFQAVADYLNKQS